MKKGNKVVLGIFDSRSQVESCVDALKTAGFRSSDISVLLPEMGDSQTFAHEKNTKAPEGATTGTGVGAILGGTLGWLVGAGVIATMPFLGTFVAAGPLARIDEPDKNWKFSQADLTERGYWDD